MSQLIPIKAISPTSYSHIKTFEQCPKKFYHSNHLNEYPFVETEAIREGHAFHKAAEDYIREGDELPPKFNYAKDMLDALDKKKGEKHTELKLGVTYDLEPCRFFSKQVWIRGAVDLAILNGRLAWVLDYKTGKNSKYADVDQLELMALLIFAKFPEVQEIRAGLIFVKANELIKRKYDRVNYSEMWAGWIARHKRMLRAHKLNKWATKESGLCANYCPVVECIHNGANN